MKAMCTDIFQHIFAEKLPQESDHDYSVGSPNLELKLEHMLYHLRDSGDLFMGFLKNYLRELFGRYLDEFSSEVPEDFLLHHLVGSFAEAVKWWIKEDTKHSPEEVASYYMAMIGK